VRTDFVYDAMNRQKDRFITMTSSGGQTYHWKTDYDAAGNRIQTTDSNGILTKYQYEVLDRVILQAVDPAGLNLVAHIAYAVGVISPGYKIDTSDPTYTYRFVENPRGFTTTEIYDKKGRLRFQYDELGNVTKFNYNAVSLRRRQSPD
jgi:YD repeat-containing protein